MVATKVDVGQPNTEEDYHSDSAKNPKKNTGFFPPRYKKPVIFTKKVVDKATEIDENRFVQAGFYSLDAFNLFLSGLKTGFDYTSPRLSSGALMHDWLITPEGITIQILGSLIFASYGCSFGWLAKSNKKNGKKNNNAGAEVALSVIKKYDYVRDIIKMICWTQRGLRTVGDVICKNPLASSNLQQLNQSVTPVLMPLSIAFGALGLLNRVYNRKLNNKRKFWQEKHMKMVDYIRERWHILSMDECNEYFELANDPNKDNDDLKTIASQSNWGVWGKNWGFASAVLGGVIDGIYTYLGVLTLTYALNPYLYLSLLALSIFYITTCIITRCYEEKTFQDKLVRTQKEVESALLARQVYLQMLDFNRYFNEKNILKDATDKGLTVIPKITFRPEPENDGNENQLQKQTTDCAARFRRTELESDEFGNRLQVQTTDYAARFEKVRKELSGLNESTYVTATFSGLRVGLSFYAPFTNILYTAAFICTISSITFPPWLLVAGVLSGIVCLTVFVVKALIQHKELLDYKHGCDLYKMQSLPSDLNNYRNSYIRINDDVYYINWQAIKEDVHLTSPEFFKSNLILLGKDCDQTYLTAGQINQLITNNGLHTPKENKNHFYQEFITNIEKLKNRVEGKAEQLRLQRILEEDFKPNIEDSDIDMQQVGYTCGQMIAAFRKAEKGAEFMANSAQTMGSDGKYHAPNEPVMWAGIAGSALLHLGIYGARNWGKIGRKELTPPVENLGPIQPTMKTPLKPINATDRLPDENNHKNPIINGGIELQNNENSTNQKPIPENSVDDQIMNERPESQCDPQENLNLTSTDSRHTPMDPKYQPLIRFLRHGYTVDSLQQIPSQIDLTTHSQPSPEKKF